MSVWLRIALIVVLALVLWWLAVALGRGVAQRDPAATGMVIPIEARSIA